MRVQPEQAQAVYTVLVNEAGASNSESDRMQFQRFIVTDGDEYRFIGMLGFGGKFWNGRYEWTVSCYREDLTPEREETIARTNHALAELQSGTPASSAGLPDPGSEPAVGRGQ